MGIGQWIADMVMPRKNAGVPAQRPSKSFVPGKYMYPAGQIDPHTASWSTAPLSVSQVTYQQLSAIRSRSRQQYRGSDYIKRYAKMCRSNIVGPDGMRFQSYARGPDGKVDLDLARRVEAEVNGWLDDGVDYYQEQSWADLLNNMLVALPIDGEIFARMWAGPGAGPWGLSVQLIDPEYIDLQNFRDLQNGNRIRFGIEFNSSGRVVAYHISPTYGSAGAISPLVDARSQRSTVRVPKRSMLHILDREFVDQVRGFPWTATAIPRTWQMEKFDEAALVNARGGASKMMLFTSDEGEGPYSDGEWPNGYQVTKIVPGMAEALPAGLKPVTFDPTYPNNEYEPYTQRNLRGAASGLDVAYESLANDRSSVNYSSLRAGVHEDRDTWRSRQKFVNRNFCEPLINRFFMIRALMPDSVFYGLSDEQFKGVTEHRWHSRTWAPVDPIKDVTASRLEIEMGVKSRTQHMRDASRDPAQTWEEIQKETQIMEELGIHPVTGGTNDPPEEGDENG